MLIHQRVSTSSRTSNEIEVNLSVETFWYIALGITIDKNLYSDICRIGCYLKFLSLKTTLYLKFSNSLIIQKDISKSKYPI